MSLLKVFVLVPTLDHISYPQRKNIKQSPSKDNCSVSSSSEWFAECLLNLL